MILDLLFKLFDIKFLLGFINNGVLPRKLVEDEEEKIHGLNALMKQSTGKDDWTFEPKMVNAVCVFKLIVKTMTCKEHL